MSMSKLSKKASLWSAVCQRKRQEKKNNPKDHTSFKDLTSIPSRIIVLNTRGCQKS